MKRKSSQKCVLPGKVLVLSLLILNIWIINYNYINFVDSDDASELILARQLVSEGNIISQNWYYSTELRVLNTQLVYMFLFLFTSSFKLVRILGQTVLSCLLLASYYFGLYSIDKDKAGVRFWKTAFLLLLPAGRRGKPWIFLAMKGYYVPHICISFLALGMICHMIKSHGRTKRWMAAGIILGFLSGLGGIRSLQLTYLPLVMSVVWMFWNTLTGSGWEEAKCILRKTEGVFLCALSALAGYLVNDIYLKTIYHFQSFGETLYNPLTMTAVETTVREYLKTLGYIEWEKTFSFKGIGNALACAFALLFLFSLPKVYRGMKKCKLVEQMVFSYALLSFAFNIFTCIITNNILSRYIMASIVPSIYFLILLESSSIYRKLEWSICGTILLTGIIGYLEVAEVVINEDKLNAIQYIEDHGNSYGYATFWNANVITELLDGQISFRNLEYNSDTGTLTESNWLEPVEDIPPDEPVIGIFEKYEIEKVDFYAQQTVYEDETFIILEFASRVEAEMMLGL